MANSLQIGDLVDFKPSHARSYQPGRIIDVNQLAKLVLVEPLFPRARQQPEEHPLKRVRPLKGRRLAEVQQRLQRLRLLVVTMPERAPAPPAPPRAPRVAHLAPLRAVPKPRAPLCSLDFLAAVRGSPCCACRRPGPSEAHHYGPRGVGQKADDLRAVPLCRACHDHLHARGELPGRTPASTRELIYPGSTH